MAVVRCRQRQTAVPCQIDQHREHGFLLRQTVILYFDIEIALAEDFPVPERRLPCRLVVPLGKLLRNLPAQAGGQCNQPSVIAAQQLLVHARLVVKALGKGERHHFAQIPVALVALAQKNQVIGIPVRADRLFEPGRMRHINLAPDDRLDALLFARLPERHRAVHHAVIGQRDRLLPARFHTRGNIRNPARAVKQTVFTVQMQVYKSVHMLSLKLRPWDAVPNPAQTLLERRV